MGRTLQAYKRLYSSLGKKEPASLYFLYGSEEYLKREFVNSLVRQYLSEENRTFNMDVFHGEEFDRELFDDRLRSFPLFSSRRFILIRSFDRMSASGKDFVIERLHDLPRSLTVVIESSSEKLDNARLRALKKLADEEGLSFECKSLSAEETIERVKVRLAREKLQIDDEAAALLVESVGTNLMDLANEMDKIVLVAQPGKRVERSGVEEVVGKYRTEGVFAFLDGLGSRSLADTLREMSLVLDGGEEPVFLTAMLIRRTVQLLQIKWAGERRTKSKADTGSLARELDFQGGAFILARLVRQAGLFDREALERLQENLLWADEKIKSSAISPRTILEEALTASFSGKRLASYPI